MPTLYNGPLTPAANTLLPIDIRRGFLPATDPVTEYEDDFFKELTTLSQTLPILIKEKKVQEKLNCLTSYRIPEAWPHNVRCRANAIIAALCHAYSLEAGKKDEPVILPKNIARLFYQSASEMLRVPTQTYETYILQNWRMIDKDKGFTFENIEPLLTFTDTEDEKWFIKTHVITEYLASDAINSAEQIKTILSDFSYDNRDAVIAQLTQCFATIGNSLSAIKQNIKHMYDHCSPDNFFNFLRRFLKNWEHGVIFEGVDYYGNQVVNFRGASGAQSSIIPALDGILQLNVVQMETMQDMLRYMPPEHIQFLVSLKSIELKFYLQMFGDKALMDKYDELVQLMTQFRKTHESLTQQYIVQFILKGLTEAVRKQMEEKGYSDKPIPPEFINEILRNLFFGTRESIVKYNLGFLLDAENQQQHTDLLNIIYDNYKILSTKVLGTGGTDFTYFLRNNIKQTEASKIQLVSDKPSLAPEAKQPLAPVESTQTPRFNFFRSSILKSAAHGFLLGGANIISERLKSRGLSAAAAKTIGELAFYSSTFTFRFATHVPEIVAPTDCLAAMYKAVYETGQLFMLNATLEHVTGFINSIGHELEKQYHPLLGKCVKGLNYAMYAGLFGYSVSKLGLSETTATVGTEYAVSTLGKRYS